MTSENPKADDIEGDYEGMTSNLAAYAEFAPLPFPNLSLSDLDGGAGVALTLLQHEAKWHCSCKAKVKTSMIDRLRNANRKRKHSDPQEISSEAKYTRSQSEPFSNEQCFLNYCTVTCIVLCHPR